MTTFRAGIAYFAAVFAVGFLLGVIRVLFIIPRVGEMTAVLIEGPVILSISWIFCGRLLRRFAVPEAIGSRLAMGAIALILTLTAELGISLFLAGRTLPEHLELYRLTHVQIGLAAQTVFALFPAIQSKTA
jgi:hypothetical protein